MPFARAAAELDWFCGAAAGAETARRLTEAAGAALVAHETAEAERLAAEMPAPAAGPRVQQLSADGTMVPLVRGEWAEVKALAVGTVEASRGADGASVVRTTGVSYFARLADADAFGRLALAELHRRGTATAGTVAAVNDGAAWEQGLVDLHRPDALRILDFAHALEHLNAAAQACFGEGTPAAVAWLDQQATELKEGDPDRVLAALGALPTARAADPVAATGARAGTLGYLSARRAQIAYARFRALGLPIGSGMVESGHKSVVQQRLKGAGMHWARPSVDPMLALRCAACNDRWGELWPSVTAGLRARARPARPCAPRGLSAHQAGRPARRPRPARPRVAPRPRREPAAVAGRPTAAHPWKQAAARAAARKASRSAPSAKI
jgi:hypothetical protein